MLVDYVLLFMKSRPHEMPAKWDQIRVSFYLNQLEKVSEFIAKVALQYESTVSNRFIMFTLGFILRELTLLSKQGTKYGCPPCPFYVVKKGKQGGIYIPSV